MSYFEKYLMGLITNNLHILGIKMINILKGLKQNNNDKKIMYFVY